MAYHKDHGSGQTEFQEFRGTPRSLCFSFIKFAFCTTLLYIHMSRTELILATVFRS